ncbi:MAG: preprotein translocase subunit SecE [Gemmatimonadaceae bacterium]
MADVAVRTGKVGGFVTDFSGFLLDVRAEMRKVTWPTRSELRQATIAIIIFVLAIGALIALMDVVLQALLVRGIPALFGSPR